ncbi:MAG: hypothetical protein J6J30_05290 [Clostridia bacterium]|nr:hypothetical protein [Clostridia bacterium]
MPYLYLLSAIAFSASLSILGTCFNAKNKDKKHISNLYNLLICCSVTLSWSIIYIFDFSFEPKVLPYSAGYGICYTLAMIGHIKALKSGSVALTAFVKQLSLVGVSFWGFAFWDTPLTKNTVIGLIFIAIALSLCFFTGNKKTEQNSAPAVTLKWLIYAAFLIVGNAGCSIIQKYEQMAFNFKHGSMLMVFGTLFASLTCLILFLREDKPDWRKVLKGSWYLPTAAGVSSAALNLFIIIMASTTLSESVIYPGIAVGGLTLTTLASVVFFKERLKWSQWIGLGVGVIALVFLNI